MGQTLTHGIYLPDEGERNCYDGLASNWSILDGAVGTIAEHTSALAGKAPLVHTHVKSDITDLFNSANVWTETNTFNKNLILKGAFLLGNVPASNVVSSIAFKGTDDNASQDIRFIIDTNGETYTDIRACNKFTSGALSPSGGVVINEFKLGVSSAGIKYIYSNAQWQNNLTPLTNNAYDLGSSSYQWNNLYAKKVNTQSVNGINPGALSLPVTATADASGDIVPPPGESSINLSGNANTYTPSNNGWLTLAINCASGNCIIVRQNTSNRDTLNYMQGYVPGQTNIYLTLPVLAGVTYYVFLYATSFVMAKFALCQGNV